MQDRQKQENIIDTVCQSCLINKATTSILCKYGWVCVCYKKECGKYMLELHEEVFKIQKEANKDRKDNAYPYKTFLKPVENLVHPSWGTLNEHGTI